ncbi:unnamed protein product [Sympodiomycopsis kandeliae]
MISRIDFLSLDDTKDIFLSDFESSDNDISTQDVGSSRTVKEGRMKTHKQSKSVKGKKRAFSSDEELLFTSSESSSDEDDSPKAGPSTKRGRKRSCKQSKSVKKEEDALMMKEAINAMRDAVTIESAFSLEDLEFSDEACQKAIKRAINGLKEQPVLTKRLANGTKAKLADGTWEWVTHPLQAPERPAEDVKTAVLEMCKSHATGQLNIDGTKPRKWQQNVNYQEELNNLLSRLTPLGQSIVEAVQRDPSVLSTKDFWEGAPSLDTDSTEENDTYLNPLVLHVISLFDDDGNLIGLYVGQSIDAPLRAEQHGSQMDLTVEGMPAQQLVYLEGRKAATRIISALATFDEQDPLSTIGFGEQVVCWMLGTYRMKSSLLEARQAKGLKVVPRQGLNSTPCLEGPHIKLEGLDLDQRRHRNRSHGFAKLINKLVSALLSGKNTLAADIRHKMNVLIPVLNTLKGRLLVDGQFRWSCASRVLFGISLPQHIMTAIDFDSKPNCLLAIGEGASIAVEDMFLAGEENLRAKYRGLRFRIRIGNQSEVHNIQCVRDPIPYGRRRVAGKIVSWIGEDAIVRRGKAQTDKEQEVAARNPPAAANLTEMALCGAQRSLLLKSFSTASLPSAPQDYRFLIPRNRTVVLEEFLGLSPFRNARVLANVTHSPAVRLA